MTTQHMPLDVSEVIAEAVERCGIDPSSLEHNHLASARRSLLLTILDIEGSDVAEADYTEQWDQQIDRNQRLVLLPDDTLDVLDAVIIDANGGFGSKLQLARITRQDELTLNDAQVRGRPSRFWVARQATMDLALMGGSDGTAIGTGLFGYGVIGGAPSPAASVTTIDTPMLMLHPATDRLGYTLRVNRLKLIPMPAQMADKPNFRRNWTDAVIAGLAARMALKIAPDRQQLLKGEWLEAKQTATIESRERGVVVLSGRGFGRAGRRGRW